MSSGYASSTVPIIRRGMDVMINVEKKWNKFNIRYMVTAFLWSM
jgi:hypothetical protein